MEIPIIHNDPGEGIYPVNLFWMPELEDGRAGLIGTPGLTLLKEVDSSGGEIRGLWKMDGYLYIVCKDAVYRYKNGNITTCTGSLLTSSGPVYMADNGTQLMIVDGQYGYIVTGTTVTQITDTDFPTPSSLTFQDGYFIVTESGTGRIWISAINDGTSWDALDYSTAEAKPDDALRVVSDHRELWVFGSKSIEVYYNSGNADFPFERISGAYQTKGISAPQSVGQGDNTIFWLSDTRQVLRALGVGQAAKIVSTRQLERRFESYSKVSDAFGFCIENIMGSTWYVLTFPTENVTWVLNVSTGRWHQWASYPSTWKDIRHRSNCYVYYSGMHIIGDYHNGRIYKLDPAAYSDYGNTIRAVATLPNINKDRKYIYHNRLEIEFKAGVGLATGQGEDPQAMLQWSDDGGRTWSNEHWRSMGKIGEYTRRATWHRLGRAINRIYRVSITDPVERVIYNPASLDFDIGGY